MVPNYHAKRYLTFLSLGFLVLAIFSNAIASDNGTAAADFLNIGMGARGCALGGAFTAVSDDASSVYWNPGGLTAVSETQLIFSHYAWYQDMSLEHLALAHSVSDRLTVGFATSYMSYGRIEGYNEYDVPTGEVNSVYDLMVGISAGYNLVDYFSAGFTTKLIVLSLADVTATSIALDLGLKYEYNQFLMGFSLANLGGSPKFRQYSENLPLLIRLGVGARLFDEQFLTTLEVENQFHGSMKIKNGYEAKLQDRYFVRAGYALYPGQDGSHLNQDLSFGVGAFLGPAAFDYTFSPQDDFSSESLHRFSISLLL